MKHSIKSFIGCGVLALCFTACSNNGFNDTEQLYRESLAALKSKDKAKIKKFVTAILPDKGTAKYMEAHSCSYRGYPEGLKKYPHAVDSAISMYTQTLYSYALSLEKNGILDDLQFIGFDSKLYSEPLSPNCKDILIQEPFGLFASPKSNDTIGYKLGELLYVDGKWKSFTKFKLW